MTYVVTGMAPTRNGDGVSDALADRFKAGFRRYPTGVAIVASSTEDGPVGATVSSVSSVSADPPLLSFSVKRSGRSGQALVGSGHLAVHVLTEDQAHVAAAFADRTAPRFTPEQGWTLPHGEPPALDDVAASFYGHIARVVPAGEAWLVLLAVDSVDLGDPADPIAPGPLLHHDRRYWSGGTPIDPATIAVRAARPLGSVLPERAS